MSTIAISIDVTLLDKTRFKEMTRKNGKRAVFADMVLIHTPDGKYGDWMVKQGVTKEERAARLEMPILGNGKTLAAPGTRIKIEEPPANPAAKIDAEDVPF